MKAGSVVLGLLLRLYLAILSDPTIPHIPFSQIEICDAIGRGACGTVYRGVPAIVLDSHLTQRLGLA